MLRRGRSITGKLVGPNKVNSKTIKPSKTRKIIRRYHFLNQTKQKLLKLLNVRVENESFYRTLQTGNVNFAKGFNCDRDDKDIENKLIKIHQLDKKPDELYMLLGYVYQELADEKGLANYQIASRMGQDSNRGGDSSKILIQWIKELIESKEQDNAELCALEIGSLSKNNKISTSGIFNPVIRIDLNNSNDDEGIIRQDFMKRPIPKTDKDRFDLISCSLVLNFVPTALERGDLCQRFKFFLKQDTKEAYIFIVLPLPCLSNSRYMSTDRFHKLMQSLGYTNIRYHEAKKVCYMLYKRHDLNENLSLTKLFYKKQQSRDGHKMNNFNILLRDARATNGA